MDRILYANPLSRVALSLHCCWVRPFDYAQGAHPTATASPPFQSGVGFVVLEGSCLCKGLLEVVLNVNHYVFAGIDAGAKV